MAGKCGECGQEASHTVGHYTTLRHVRIARTTQVSLHGILGSTSVHTNKQIPRLTTRHTQALYIWCGFTNPSGTAVSSSITRYIFIFDGVVLSLKYSAVKWGVSCGGKTSCCGMLVMSALLTSIHIHSVGNTSNVSLINL